VTGEAVAHRRCPLALGVLAVGVLLVLGALVLPWLQRRDYYDDAIAQRSRQLQRYQAVIARLPALEERLKTVHANREMDAYYLSATSPSQGGIALQRSIEDMISKAGGTLTSIQILPVEEQETVDRIGVRLRFSGATEALQRLLFAVETGKPLLFVERMDVRVIRRSVLPRGGGRPALHSDLNVNMDIYGYIRKAAG
jgi:general secretion pathway protein M